MCSLVHLIAKLTRSVRRGIAILARILGRSLPTSRARSQVDNSRNPDIFAGEALHAVLYNCHFSTVLDVGSGAGRHADIFEEYGKQVTTIDFGRSVYFQQKNSNRCDIIADYYKYQFGHQFDLIWASHVLEHQPNPNLFMSKIFKDLKDEGWLAITVPPLKHEIVGGHVTLWNGGLLLYQLILAGFNCRRAAVRQYGYNISLVVKKVPIVELPILHYDSGDIDRLGAYFPEGFHERFDGDIRSLQWPARDEAIRASAMCAAMGS